MFNKKYKLLTMSLFLSVLGLLAMPSTVSAAEDIVCPDGFHISVPNPAEVDYNEKCANHMAGGSAGDDMEEAQIEGDKEADCLDPDINAQNCGIVSYVVTFTRVLSGLVGIIIVIMITIGGVQFSAARDNPQAVAAARERIVNALLALVFYMFAFTILQWLVPGGIL